MIDFFSWLESRGVPPESEKWTKSDSFKRWFGDSKVTRYYGGVGHIPLAVYHGSSSNAPFQSFKNIRKTRSHNTAGLGFWFSDSPEYAGRLAITKSIAHKEKFGPSASHVLPVYLSIKNPKIYGVFSDLEEDMEKFQGNAGILRKELIKSGYDGIKIQTSTTDFHDIASIHWAAFYPSQIKSIHNSGVFDIASKNMLEFNYYKET